MSSYTTSGLFNSTPAVTLPQACYTLIESLGVHDGRIDRLKTGLQGLLTAPNMSTGRTMIVFNQLIKEFFLSTNLSATDSTKRMDETKGQQREALSALNAARSNSHGKDAVLIHGVAGGTESAEVSPDK